MSEIDPPESPVFLITGCPGSGKTTTATALMRRFKRGVRISVDDLRSQVVSGLASPIPVWTDETSRQFTLARRAAGFMAREYAEAGFSVVVEDVGRPHDFAPIFESLEGRTAVKVLLHPSAAVCAGRARDRTGKDYDPTRLCEAIPGIHSWIAEGFEGADDWLRIDSSSLGLDEVVERLLRRVD